MSTNATAPIEVTPDARVAELGPLPRVLEPLVDWVARIRATVHTKLLVGFLLIALLLLGLGGMSMFVLARINDQIETLTTLYKQTSDARHMIYDVTAQSHYRAMQLLTGDPIHEYDTKLDAAKADFAKLLKDVSNYALSETPGFFANLRATNAEFNASSVDVTALFDQGHIDQALNLHIAREHTLSHALEDPLNAFIDESQKAVAAETASFRSDRRFLTLAVGAFSGVSILAALALGAVLSWSLIRPVRRMDTALEQIANGDFETSIAVPNNDEFGNLTRNLNRTSDELAAMYTNLQSLNADLRSLNDNLRATVERKVAELERTSRLKRYVSPQLAESIVSGERDIDLAPSRKFLTTFFSDVRGFTEAAERMEPEELIDELNEYLSEMTEIVFKHGGTLDKYVGDAVMVFFGDPVPQDDHARRAVQMALEMRDRMKRLQETWLRRYNEVFKIGIGISTGWVTVGNIGSSARSDYTVLGNHVNLAARLADRAEAGQILVTERTFREVDDLVQGSVVDEVSLKGVSRPIRIYDVNERT
jgi:class 3 adenylate cyclase/HAMP domain-containing protein